MNLESNRWFFQMISRWNFSRISWNFHGSVAFLEVMTLDHRNSKKGTQFWYRWLAIVSEFLMIFSDLGAVYFNRWHSERTSNCSRRMKDFCDRMTKCAFYWGNRDPGYKSPSTRPHARLTQDIFRDFATCAEGKETTLATRVGSPHRLHCSTYMPRLAENLLRRTTSLLKLSAVWMTVRWMETYNIASEALCRVDKSQMNGGPWLRKNQEEPTKQLRRRPKYIDRRRAESSKSR